MPSDHWAAYLEALKAGQSRENAMASSGLTLQERQQRLYLDPVAQTEAAEREERRALARAGRGKQAATEYLELRAPDMAEVLTTIASDPTLPAPARASAADKALQRAGVGVPALTGATVQPIQVIVRIAGQPAPLILDVPSTPVPLPPSPQTEDAER